MTPLRFAVIGDPVGHSKSPALHGAAFRALGWPHTYEALRTPPAELAARVQALRDGIFAGLNVTVPHKTTVLSLVDDVAESARRAGAANTLVRSAEGRVVAHNTDTPALVAELGALVGAREGDASSWGGGMRALVLGSGGVARAAVHALDALGVRDVVVRARRSGAAFELRPGAPQWQAWGPDAASEARTAVVVQATSAGMTGADPGDAAAVAVAWDALPAAAVALDVVYAPERTPFLDAARSHGLRACGGLGMLARQGALSLELWTGIEAPREVMLEALAPSVDRRQG